MGRRHREVAEAVTIRNHEQLKTLVGLWAITIVGIAVVAVSAISDYERGADHCPERDDLHCFMDPVPIEPVVFVLAAVTIGATVVFVRRWWDTRKNLG